MDIRHFFPIFKAQKEIQEIQEIHSIKLKKIFKVFTDGSSFNNGSKTKKHKGGLGIFFEDGHPNNKSIKLIEHPITNNIAELKACIKAIEIILDTNPNLPLEIIIYTDSEYVINSITKWAKIWRFNGWKKKQGSKLVDIKNKELIITLYTLVSQNPIKFKHVKAHKSAPTNKTSDAYKEWYGNYMADKLATTASNLV
jgi:ribonuclease HI|tara:strand:- start:375 stop:965 length:591 start_codon:yes stop_codon:yes gene_type:complete